MSPSASSKRSGLAAAMPQIAQATAEAIVSAASPMKNQTINDTGLPSAARPPTVSRGARRLAGRRDGRVVAQARRSYLMPFLLSTRIWSTSAGVSGMGPV